MIYWYWIVLPLQTIHIHYIAVSAFIDNYTLLFNPPVLWSIQCWSKQNRFPAGWGLIILSNYQEDMITDGVPWSELSILTYMIIIIVIKIFIGWSWSWARSMTLWIRWGYLHRWWSKWSPSSSKRTQKR